MRIVECVCVCKSHLIIVIIIVVASDVCGIVAMIVCWLLRHRCWLLQFARSQSVGAAVRQDAALGGRLDEAVGDRIAAVVAIRQAILLRQLGELVLAEHGLSKWCADWIACMNILCTFASLYGE